MQVSLASTVASFSAWWTLNQSFSSTNYSLTMPKFNSKIVIRRSSGIRRWITFTVLRAALNTRTRIRHRSTRHMLHSSLHRLLTRATKHKTHLEKCCSNTTTRWSWINLPCKDSSIISTTAELIGCRHRATTTPCLTMTLQEQTQIWVSRKPSNQTSTW